MTKLFTFTLSMLSMLLIPFLSFGQARVQVIHNSADTNATTVDVWLNDQLLLDDFMFRTASPFIDAPSGVDFDVVIQPANSTDTINALARFTYNLMEDSTYILVANGIVVPDGYDPATPFDIYVFDMGQETAASEGNSDVLVFHGSTDAPIVDVVETLVGAGTIVDNLAYGEFAGYLELGTDDYVLEVRDEDGNTTVAAYSAPLETLELEGQAMVVLASGFLDSTVNNNGPAFGLFVALPAGGDLIPLPLFTPNAIVNVDLSNRINLFPVPAVSQVEVNSPERISLLKIINIAGVEVQRTIVDDFSLVISIDNLKSGIYLMLVETEKGIAVKKFAVK